MKRIFTLFVSLALVLGCQKAGERELEAELMEKSGILPKKGCEGAGKVVFGVSEQTGVCSYDENSRHYYIRYHVSGTYDSAVIGVVCNMPEEFMKGNGELEVVFSGVFKEIQNNNLHAGPVGTVYHYLELTNIRPKPDH